jgi:type I restriction enzyme S subunit
MRNLPAGWKRTSLGAVLDRIEAGKSFAGELRPAAIDEWGVIKVSAMTYGTFRENENKAVAAGTAFSEAAEIRPGDLLLSRANTRDYVGASVLVGDCRSHLLLSDKSLRLCPTAAADRRWLWYALSAPQSRRYLSDTSTGVKAGMRNVSQVALRAMPLMLPPLAEQRRIVDILDDHVSRLDAAERLTFQAERRSRALRSSSLNAIISRRERERRPLRHLVERIEAGKSFGTAAPPAGPDEWGIIKVSAMTWGEFRPDENKAVQAVAVDPRYEIRSGDLLVSRANTSDYVGASVLVEAARPRLLLSDKSLRLVPRDGVDRRWLWLALSSPEARTQISAKATGTKDSMRNISQSGLLAVEIPYVSLAEQQVDIARLATCFDSLTGLTEALRPVKRRCKALRRALLNAALSGDLTRRVVEMETVEEMADV